MSIETLSLPREATLQFNDVYGPLPVSGDTTPPAPADFDAAVTSQVRNTGRFCDGEYGISDGGAMLGGYASVLVDDLRHSQRAQGEEILTRLGVSTVDEVTPQMKASLHPDELPFLESLRTSVVAVINEAPRNARHNQTGQNGNDFYVATTDGAEYYAQAHLLSSLHARGRIQTLHRIPEGVVWPRGEQFRSSVVTQARRHPEKLEPVALDTPGTCPIPPLPDGVQVAYVDKFGNVRAQTSDISTHGQLLREAGKESAKLDLVLHDGRTAIAGLHVVSRLTEIPEGEFGAYVNPADRETKSGPAYLEIVRRVSDPNGGAQERAFHVLRTQVSKLLGTEVQLSDWNNIFFDLVPHRAGAAGK